MDHETSGAQEWLLPGYGRELPKKTTSTSNKQTQAPPRNTNTPEQQKRPSTTSPRTPPTGPKNAGTPSRAVVTNRGTSYGKDRRSSRGRGTNYRGTTSSQSNSLLRDSPAKARWRNGTKPNGSVPLPKTFGLLKSDFFSAARSGTSLAKHTPGQDRSEVFEDISKRTGAFVKSPAYSDSVVQIWGEPHQVSMAEEQIKSIVLRCTTQNKPKAGNEFPKVKAHSAKEEANIEVKEKGENWMHELRKPPEAVTSFQDQAGLYPDKFPHIWMSYIDNSRCSMQFLFEWPKDGPSLNECLGPDLEFLDTIRARFNCYMFVLKDLPGYICAVGHASDVTKELAQSLRILWVEAVAKSNIKAKVYLVEPPAPEAMKGKIVVKIQNQQLHRPALRGNRLKGHELREWQGRVSLVRSKNDHHLLNAVESCLKGLSFVRGHLRMRVNLGTFLLERYPKPEGDKSWYGFEEFREILLHEQTQGRLVPALKVAQPELLERCFEATHLLQPYDSTLRRDAPAHTSASLKNARLTHSVNFEFLGADRSMLRLEVEFAKTPGAKEYAIKERRWLRPRDGGQSADKRSPLHIAVVDFGRSDWQLEIKSFEFHETSSIDSALKAFAHSVGFRNSENTGDITAKPERKVTFPLEPPVSRVVEKTAIRYQLLGTDYILEVARYDEYRRMEVPIGQTGATMPGGMPVVPYTTWGASIFDPNWDNLLGGHANLPVGHSAKYSPNLATFFPSRENLSLAASKDQSQGFWDFVTLVKQAAELLGPTRVAPEETDADIANKTGSTSLKAATKSDGPSPTASTAPAAPAAPSPTEMLDADLGTLF